MARLFKLYSDAFHYQKDNLSCIDYLKANNKKLYYVYDNIFNYIELKPNLFGNRFDDYVSSVGTFRKTFIQNYYNFTAENLAHTYPIKYLIDTFMYHNPKTVFALHDNNNMLSLSKGTKKIIAYDALEKTNAHILIVSEKSFGSEIVSDEDLYWLLRKISPEDANFKIIVEGAEQGARIHYAEANTTIGKWSAYDKFILELYKHTLPSTPLRVKFEGAAYTTDNRILERSSSYYCRVYSKRLIDISLDYIVLNSLNSFYRKRTRIGTSLDNNVLIEYCWKDPAVSADFFIPNPF